MKKIKASELKEGDIYFYEDYYAIVTTSYNNFKSCKCFMSPSSRRGLSSIRIGSRFIIWNNVEVLLCEVVVS